jgi:hypothetical protein
MQDKARKTGIMQMNVSSEGCGRILWLDAQIRGENRGSRSQLAKQVGRPWGLNESGRKIQLCNLVSNF